MSKALKVWEQVIANNNCNDDLIEQFYFLCKEEAKQEAEERIIKLLEADMEHAFGEDGKCLYDKHYREVCNCDIIALIKGEQK